MLDSLMRRRMKKTVVYEDTAARINHRRRQITFYGTNKCGLWYFPSPACNCSNISLLSSEECNLSLFRTWNEKFMTVRRSSNHPFHDAPDMRFPGIKRELRKKRSFSGWEGIRRISHIQCYLSVFGCHFLLYNPEQGQLTLFPLSTTRGSSFYLLLLRLTTSSFPMLPRPWLTIQKRISFFSLPQSTLSPITDLNP